MPQMMPNWLRQRAYLTPKRPALFFEEKRWTFAELYEEVKRWTAALERIGVQPGDYIGVLVKNTEQAVFLIHALQQRGAVAVLLNHRLAAEELSFQLKDSRAAFLLYDSSFETLAKKAGKDCLIKQELSRLPLQAAANGRQELDLEEVCSVMYTSGTTGKPKGVMQTYGNHWWSAAGSALNLGIRETDCWICAVPLFHISGYSILIRSVIYGMAVRLYSQFNEAKINRALQRGEATIMSVVTAMLTRMVEQLQGSYHPSFRCMLLGGGPAPKPLLESCAAKQIPVFQTYGMTETASQIVTLPPEYSLTKLGSAGKPLFPSQIKIADGQNEGEILVKGPNVTAGYLRREEANRQSFTDGWFHTGDLGRLDEDGFLYVLDRRSDLIISGGENVYPAEIESVLMEHPAIAEAGVIGVPDEKWGQVPAAFLVAKKTVDTDSLRSFCLSRLAKYKCPAHFLQVKALPRNASKKLLRRELKAAFEREGR
ncbi:o-succinylbenzoate--CoA ligase [Bacillus xiapuensis]|uniref:o-succinylbenzoate--CoA ligase n=1 Tax=Bacillus xiapuensis TaxID=2014075 RepID=UPI000C23D384|nr:o-succinylbenzoate--CoA ligase [Bacillus xiapuensis]